jgi:hypothetical protein
MIIAPIAAHHQARRTRRGGQKRSRRQKMPPGRVSLTFY